MMMMDILRFYFNYYFKWTKEQKIAELNKRTFEQLVKKKTNEDNKKKREYEKKYALYIKHCTSPSKINEYLPEYWDKLRPHEKSKWLKENMKDDLEYFSDEEPKKG